MFKELLFMSISKNLKITIINILQFSLSFLLIIVSCNTIYEISNSFNHLIFLTEKEIYKINDNFFGEDEQMFFTQKDNVNILKSLYMWECNNNSFDYIIANRQYGYVLDRTFPEVFLAGYESSSIIDEGTYKSLQVNDRFIIFNNLNIFEGRLFNKNDYILSENNQIPVLLGYEYYDYINLHDNFHIYYLGIEFECKVIGFLNENNYYNIQNSILKLDRYIILPSLEFNDIANNEIQKKFELKLYLDKTSSYIYTEMSPYTIQNLVNNKCTELEISPFKLEQINNYNLNIWGLEGKIINALFLFYTIFTIIISIICISINITVKIMKQKLIYSIYMANGIHQKTILFSIFCEILILTYISFLLAIIGASIFMPGIFIYFNITIPICFIICFFSYIYPAYKLKSINISKTLRGDI